MMKEAALFTVSSGVLIYFLSPVSEEPVTVPEKVEQEVKRAPSQSPPVDDSWGYEDEDEYEDEEFVFGEPLVSDDDEYDDEYDDENDQTNGELSEIVESTNSSSTQAQIAQSQKPSRSHPDSPKGNQRGSKENPVVFETNNPGNPADD